MRSRSVAAITALVFVVCGFLAARHEAVALHARDRAGCFVHARALSGGHTSTDSDIHGQRNSDGDTGECALLNAFHQATSADVCRPAVVSAIDVVCAQHAPAIALRAPISAIYRFAPKTSPPVA